jgi:LuxR family transcriptional regulator, maltose regulon positive regulatory protein
MGGSTGCSPTGRLPSGGNHHTHAECKSWEECTPPDARFPWPPWVAGYAWCVVTHATGRDSSSGPLASGWDALDRGDWAAAADLFTAAVGHDETAEGQEGLSWAAWWLNDASRLFAARQRAYTLYREAGDRAAAARMAIWLGCDHHDFRGEHAIGSGWHQRARRLLGGLAATPEHGWLAFQEGAYALELEDDTATARQRAAEAAAIGREVGLADVEVIALALEGLALVTEGRVDEGMRRLDEAGVAATSGELQQRQAGTWTMCYLIYACERVRDLDRAAQWCRRMQELSEELHFDLGVGVCRAHYGGVLVLHGDWTGGERELDQAGALLAHARPPATCESDVRLGELRRRQGRLDEATTLFARAEPHPLARLGLAAVALDRGRPDDARELLEDLLDAVPAGAVTQRADALLYLVRTAAAQGDLEAASDAERDLAEIADRVATRPLRAMAASAAGAMAAAASDHRGARRAHEEATDLYQRAVLPYEAAAARVELGRALARLGRAEAAARQLEQATTQLRALGADAQAQAAHRALDATPLAGTVAGLSPRETEVLAALVDGLSDREIAKRLTISAHTVHRHISNILTKLAVPSRTAAAAVGARHGLGRLL